MDPRIAEVEQMVMDSNRIQTERTAQIGGMLNESVRLKAQMHQASVTLVKQIKKKAEQKSLEKQTAEQKVVEPQTFYCPRCGTQLPVEANFCKGCGASVAHIRQRRSVRIGKATEIGRQTGTGDTGRKKNVVLPVCPNGHPNKPGAKFCRTCGRPVANSNPRI